MAKFIAAIFAFFCVTFCGAFGQQPKPEDGKRPAALEKLRAGIQAQLSGNFADAKAFMEEARKIDPSLTGIDYQLGVTAFNDHKPNEARVLLEKSIAEGQEVAASRNILGVMFAQEKKYAEAFSQFKLATEASPSDPQGFYNWSEALRETDRPKEAIEQLRKAIQRNPSDPLYAFKLRLAHIDAGEKDQLKAETDAQLKLQPPAGDWLMTAAAIALNEKQFEKAATYLDQSRTSMSAVLFFGMLQDPVFLRYSTTPEIAKFYQVQISQKPSGTH